MNIFRGKRTQRARPRRQWTYTCKYTSSTVILCGQLNVGFPPNDIPGTYAPSVLFSTCTNELP